MSEEVLVIFGRDFDWREPGSYLTIAYKAGMCVTVDEACAVSAIAKGYAVAAEDDVLFVPAADEILVPIVEEPAPADAHPDDTD